MSMPRRTREQKIIADLRRQLSSQSANQPIAQPTKEVEVAPKISIPDLVEVKKEVAAPVVAETKSYLKSDLLKVGGLVAVAILVELLASFSINSGALKAFGIT
jgi:hypothetical protein